MKRNDASRLLPDLPAGARLLIIRLRSLGDLVLETPVLAALHAWRPDLRISVLVEGRFAAVLEGNPAVAELIHSREFWRTVREIRRRRFAAVFNQHGGPRSALLTAASDARWRVGWKGFQFGFAYNVKTPDAAEFYGAPLAHTVEHRISQFYATGLPREPIPRAQVFPQPEAIEAIERLLGERGVAANSYAVLQPGARTPQMRWPPQRFAELARWLREKHGLAAIVNIGASDNAVAKDVRRELSSCAVIPPPLGVRELIALISRARLFVGSDSGPAHIGAACGCPAVVLYGPTDCTQWRPWRSEHRALHTGASFGSPRGDKHIPVAPAAPVSTIALEAVREACDELCQRSTNTMLKKE